MNEDFYDTARKNMILGQLVPQQITNQRVLDAMADVPRERFLSERKRTLAYADEAICLKGRRFVCEPLILARLLQAADVQSTDFVLNLQCATGYTSLILSRLAQAVVAVEDDSEMNAIAQDILIEMKTDNVGLFSASAKDGFSAQAPYDLIFIDGIVPFVPENLFAQMADNARMICVVAEPPSLIGRALKICKTDGKIRREWLFNFLLNPFCQTQNDKKFVFDAVS